jgi:hypothetical protein
MQRKHATHIGLAIMVLGLALALHGRAAAADTEASAEIRPARISLDQTAELRVVAKAGSTPVPPQVAGLHFQRTGESSEMSDVNGLVSQHTFVLYRVVADRPGKFSIPIGGRTLVLEVAPAGSGPAAATTGVGAALPSSAGRHADPGGSSDGPLAFLRVGLPRKKIFVGQALPVTFRAYFRAGTEVSLSGAPSLGIPALTVSHLDDDPRQSDESIGGVPYRVATWTAEASAAMPGQFTLQATLPIVARYRVAPQRPAADPFGDMLDDQEDMFSASPSALMRSFMKHSAFGTDLTDMFGQVRERDMTLHAPAQSIDVQPLPVTGQPANFGGAVGRFEIRTSLAPSAGTMFTPMTLSIEVSGQGNLDRVSLAGLPASADWKTYPPSAKLTAQGTKVFEQAVVPQRSGHLELPALSLSFFDPAQKQYLTRSSPPIGVEVAAAAPGTPVPAVAAAVPSPAREPTVGLRPNRVDEGRFVASLLPPYRRGWFWPAMALPWLALSAAVARSRIRLSSARTRRRATNETVAQHRLAMKSAVAAQDALHFYAAAAAALRIRLGQRWQMSPDDVTAAEAAVRLGPDHSEIVGVLSAAERLRYGGAVAEPASLADLLATVEEKLDELEAQS